MAPDQLAVISELTTTDKGFKIKLRDPHAAIRQISKMQAWDEPPKAPAVPDRLPAPVVVMSAEEYKQARAEMLAKDDC